MNLMKAIIKYAMPVIIIILLLAFIIYAATNEGFADGCVCPSGSELKNGGCYSCEPGYKLTTEYYNSFCVNSENSTKPATIKKISC